MGLNHAFSLFAFVAHSPSQIPETECSRPANTHLCVGRMQERVSVAGLRLFSAEGPAGEVGLPHVWVFPPVSKLIRAVLCAHSVCANNVIYDESPLSVWEPGISVLARQSADVTNPNNNVEHGVSNRLPHTGTCTQ